MAFVLYPGLYEFSDRFLQVETLLRRAEAIPQS